MSSNSRAGYAQLAALQARRGRQRNGRSVRAGDMPAVYPSRLAGHVGNAMKLWDDCDGIESDEPTLAESIENDWNLSEFIALYLARLSVEDRAAIVEEVRGDLK